MSKRNNAANGSGEPRHAIVLVCPHLGDGGVQRVVTTLANAWNHSGRKVVVVTVFGAEDSYRLDPGVHRIALHRTSTWLHTIEAITRLLGTASETGWNGRLAALLSGIKRSAGAILKRPAPAWLRQHLWRFYPPLTARAIALRRAVKTTEANSVVSFCGSTNVVTVLGCRGTKRRVIISERNDPSRQVLAFPWNTLREQFYRRADVVTANSRGAICAMKDYVPPTKCVYVPNPVKADVRHTPRARSRARRMLIVARLQPQKGHDVLFRALACLPARLAKWRLDVAGRGPATLRLKALARELHVATRIWWHGYVADPTALYARAAIFVLPSRHEGTPNALLEAMAHGMPVVVRDASPGPLEIVDHGVTGLIVPADDASALADTLIALADDAEWRRRMGDAARERVKEFSVPATLARWERLIDAPICELGGTA